MILRGVHIWVMLEKLFEHPNPVQLAEKMILKKFLKSINV